MVWTAARYSLLVLKVRGCRLLVCSGEANKLAHCVVKFSRYDGVELVWDSSLPPNFDTTSVV